MLSVVVLVDVGLIITFIVTALSQPTEFVRCATCVPASLKVIPFQINGSETAHIELSRVLVDVGLMLSVNVATLSQPLAVEYVCVYVPAVVAVLPHGKLYVDPKHVDAIVLIV